MPSLCHEGIEIFFFKSCLQFQTVAFMPLIWRKPKLLPVEPALLAGLLLHSKRDVRATHGGALPSKQPSALTGVSSHPCLRFCLSSQLLLHLGIAPRHGRHLTHPRSPHLIPPSGDGTNPESFWVLGADKQPEWFGGWSGERFCQCSLTARVKKMAKRQVFSPLPVSREDGSGGCRAAVLC